MWEEWIFNEPIISVRHIHTEEHGNNTYNQRKGHLAFSKIKNGSFSFSLVSLRARSCKMWDPAHVGCLLQQSI